MPVLERYRATSWSGSEDQRRPQGVCLPPARPPVVVPRFLIRAGTPCEITPLSRIGWRPYTTTREAPFERFESYDRKTKTYQFRDRGWLLRVHRRRVAHREDTYR